MIIQVCGQSDLLFLRTLLIGHQEGLFQMLWLKRLRKVINISMVVIVSERYKDGSTI